MSSNQRDKLATNTRSRNMASIRSTNTKPELALRSRLFKKGYRFRIHKRDLPGKPDIVFPKHRLAIFVHGCFWHLHDDCRDGHIPKSREEYWRPKLEKNVQRDTQHNLSLKELGWEVVIVWECEIRKRIDEVIQSIERSLILHTYKS